MRFPARELKTHCDYVKAEDLVVDEVDDVVAVAQNAIETPGDMEGVALPGIVRVGDDLVLVLGPEHVSHVAP